MKLTGIQIKQLCDALMDGFPSRYDLEMMVRIQLNERLDAIAEADDQTQRIYKLVKWAERSDRVQELVDGALLQNPSNQKLQDLRKAAISWPASEDLDYDPTRDKQFSPKISPIQFEWVSVRAGPFFMGDRELADYGRQHIVDVGAFSISCYPITNAQYEKFVDATGHRVPNHWQHGKIPNGKENHPVVKVDWFDALVFCQWAGVRLPTEAEWEKAVRGTDGRLYPWGNELPSERLCNFGKNVGDTTSVDRYPEGVSPYGVYDMTGNVLEWTSSGVYPYPYRADDGREDLKDLQMILNRIARGGSFGTTDVRYLRCTFRRPIFTRFLLPEAVAIKDVAVGLDLGFRVALSSA